MPPVRSSASIHYILLATLISLNSKIMSPYSFYTKKGLVYIAIIAPFSCQLSSYLECTKVNTYSFCDMRSVSNNKYIFSVS